jgi:hypothetical protein
MRPASQFALEPGDIHGVIAAGELGLIYLGGTADPEKKAMEATTHR